jgi:hypothetical protein
MSSEVERLAELRTFNVVGAPDNPALDAAARLAAKLFACPITAVTLIDEDTQWLAARTGLDVCSTSREDAFCAVTIQRPPRDVMVIENAATRSPLPRQSHGHRRTGRSLLCRGRP